MPFEDALEVLKAILPSLYNSRVGSSSWIVLIDFHWLVSLTSSLVTEFETALKTLKLDNYLNKKVGTLSFGEAKKLEFLRLIIENKKVWILDEPLSNLDEDSIELIKQTFEDHSSKEGSIIFSSHQNPGIYVTEEIQL